MDNSISFCTQCKGSGFIQSADCSKCRNQNSASATLNINNKRLFFDFSRITPFGIATRRTVLKTDYIINVILFFIGAFGALFLGYFFYSRVLALNVSLPLGLFSKDFWQIKSWYMRLFFLSFAVDLYTFYRIKRQGELRQFVEKKEYGAAEAKKQSATAASINGAFSLACMQVIESAYSIAAQNNFSEVAPLHILAAALSNQKSSVMLFRLGINPGLLAGKVKHGLQNLYTQKHTASKQTQIIPFSPSAKAVILQAYKERYDRGGGGKADVSDFWIACSEIEGYTREILYDLDIEPYKARAVGMWLAVEENLRASHSFRGTHTHHSFMASHGMNRAMTAVETKFLNSMSNDLTHLASRGALAPSLGHTKEIEEVFTIIVGGAKGVILVGNTGVGKESLVEEMASRMAADLVPEILQDKRLLSLSVSSILAGGSASGSSERLYRALSEAAHSGNVVLFIKDIHSLVGIGLQGEAGAETMGVDQVLSQALENGQFFVVGTTDYRSYARHIEHSPLNQVLARVEIPEPGVNDAVLMLEARVPFIEARHSVFFTYQSLEKAVVLTNKFIHTSHQPEKAHKILQETAARVARDRGARAVVGAEDIERVISEKTNMPLTNIGKNEQDKLLHLEDEIHKKYIDQEYAVSQVSNALRRARAQLRDEKRPIANFLFVGPTGVGKTELVKRIASVYFNSEKDMVRLDMSEFQEISSIPRLIGAASAPGLLTEAVRTNPYSVLLLDELEKAHPNILNIFLQVMDEGRLTSSDGEVIDFTNLIIVATSNAGTKKLQEKLLSGKSIEEVHDEFVHQDLLLYYRPEFLNRFDDVILFKPLGEKDIEQIAGLILTDIALQLEAKGIMLKIAPQALSELARAGFDPLYGARPLRRAIQDHLQNALANFVIAGRVGRRDIVHLEPGGVLRIEKAREL